MTPRERVLSAINYQAPDRLPIKHMGEPEVDEALRSYFGITTSDELLDKLGDDFRSVNPPQFTSAQEASDYTAKSGSQLIHLTLFGKDEWYDFSTVQESCLRYSNHARMLGYCQGDFINGISSERGQEQVFYDIALHATDFLDMVESKFEFNYAYIEKGLEAAAGAVDIVHFGEDLGSQQGPLISHKDFDELFAPKYRALFELSHSHGAKTMMHSCGSVRKWIPTLIAMGLDILDVVQTNAVGMEIEELQREYGKDLVFAGTMCVQKVLPFGSREQVRAEVRRRIELFPKGGLIIGPSHCIQSGTPLENILEMYRAAGGFT